MIESLNGTNLKEITLYATEGVKPGMAVGITDRYTVSVPKINKPFFGICTSVKGNFATVAVSGIITIPFSGEDIFIGYNKISADGAGYVSQDSACNNYYAVLDIDQENQLITISLDK